MSAARHQVGKLDIPDLLAVVEMAFSHLRKHERLWPSSGQTLRSRFKQILAALSLPVTKSLQLKPLDLGSLRSGGATWLITMTEQSDLVLRRGRWINTKTMGIYLQESMAVVYLQKIPQKAKDSVLLFASMMLELLTKAQVYRRAGIPPAQWYTLLKLDS